MRPTQLGWPIDPNHGPFDLDIGPHAVEFRNMLDTGWVDGVDDSPVTCRNRQEWRQRLLQVSGKTWIRLGLDADHAEVWTWMNVDGIFTNLQLSAHFFNLSNEAFNMFKNDIIDADPLASCHGSRNIGPGFNSVRNDGVGTAMQMLHALYPDDASTGTANLSPHLVKQVNDINNFWFARGILNNGLALGLNGRQDTVDGCPNTDHVHVDTCPNKAFLVGRQSHYTEVVLYLSP